MHITRVYSCIFDTGLSLRTFEFSWLNKVSRFGLSVCLVKCVRISIRQGINVGQNKLGLIRSLSRPLSGGGV